MVEQLHWLTNHTETINQSRCVDLLTSDGQLISMEVNNNTNRMVLLFMQQPCNFMLDVWISFTIMVSQLYYIYKNSRPFDSLLFQVHDSRVILI